jgi:hypothetical protein
MQSFMPSPYATQRKESSGRCGRRGGQGERRTSAPIWVAQPGCISPALDMAQRGCSGCRGEPCEHCGAAHAANRRSSPSAADPMVERTETHPLSVPPAVPAATAQALRGTDPHLPLITTPLRALLKRPPVTLPPTASIREAAALMLEEGVSSVLIVEQGHLFGIVTDRDLRNRVVAVGLETDRPVVEITTIAPLTVDLGNNAFEALLMMTRQNVHHVPVMDGPFSWPARSTSRARSKVCSLSAAGSGSCSATSPPPMRRPTRPGTSSPRSPTR